MRALIHFPIIHSVQDLGTLGAVVTNSQTESEAQHYTTAVEHVWTMIASTIESLGLDYPRLKLYQDGLPVCGKEIEIVAEVATSGSQNYQLLQNLHNKGAVLMGTESPELLLQEHTLMTQLLQSGGRDTIPLATAQTLLSQRDDYIAQRIDVTLQHNEMAILFLGLMHDIESKLPKDIVLIQPLGKPQ